MAKETYYEFMEHGEGEDAGRLLTPWQDPHVYEYAFDFSFATRAEAYAYLQDFLDGGSADWDEVSGWVLVEKTMEEVEPASAGLVRPEEDPS